MSRINPYDHFTIKPVQLEHLEQYNELLQYVFQVTSHDLQEIGYEKGELIRAKRPILRKADVIGWFEGEKLISQLAVYPCEVNIRGSVFPMGYLTGVGTYPEYASMGLMSGLMKKGLEMMRSNGQWISYLFPYSIPYYRNKGWEIISDKMSFSLKDYQLPARTEVKGFVKRQALNHKDIIRTYDHFARKTHGALIRDDLAWEEYWRWENEDEHFAALYYNKKKEPSGCLFYRIAEDIFYIKEMFYLNQEARKGLWNYISAHFSMIHEVKGFSYKDEPIAFLLEDSEITETIQPYIMARIVDLENFLLTCPFANLADKDFHFIVEDPVLEWNRGVFGLSFDRDENLSISRTPQGQPVYLDIQTLTTMLMGYKRPSYLASIERLQTDPKTLRILEQLIPQATPYFSDYF
ncbi:GNAT family N-acetyltransferase [Desulfobotulus mexicanus]|uniref:GNAT family N-acetyltransferase n=2 Tax=Desulfobotulus mexicanus TaxID=2586642 RepID=A0A5Q4VFD7_9BACT|nr:GNAT family N-acetyltransferase [Desulfobotulus mexicanus]